MISDVSYFHVRKPGTFDDDIIEPGTWAKEIAKSHMHGWAVVEYHFESVRQQLAPHLPSRRTSTFAFDTLEDAETYRAKYDDPSTSAIYEVEPVNPDATTHSTNMYLIGPELEELHGNEHVIRNAIGYWTGDHTRRDSLTEVIIDSPIRVIREVVSAGN